MIDIRRPQAAFALAALVGIGAASIANAQEPSRAEQLIKFRHSTMTVMGTEFGPLAAMAGGKIPYNPSVAQLNAERVAVLAGIAQDVFPPESKEGAPTKAKPDIWTDHADFEQKLKDLQERTAALVPAAKIGTLDALKPAVGEVGKACKACHDKYKEK